MANVRNPDIRDDAIRRTSGAGFPEALRPHVEAVVAGALGRTSDALTVAVVRATTRDWTVQASGLGDPVLVASVCDVIRDALRRTSMSG